MRTPFITEIQRFSLQDGPGIRTTIFFKGCPLKCPWCHNPETQKPGREFYFYSDKCTSCGRCVEVCPTGASSLMHGPDGRRVLALNRNVCEGCLKCVQACAYGARGVVGHALSMDRLLEESEADSAFFRHSGGGITISGGEPLLFPEFTLALVKQLKTKLFHVAVETSCFAKWEKISPLMEWVDLFLIDIKTLNPEQHEAVVGWPLAVILKNIETLAAAGANIRIHLPIIPGFNDSSANFKAITAFLGNLSQCISGVDILPYHCYGENKYTLLGRGDVYQFKNVADLPAKGVLDLALGLKREGIRSITVGGLVGMGVKSS